MNRMDYSMGLFVYYFGSKKQYKDVAHHTFTWKYISKTFRQNF